MYKHPNQSGDPRMRDTFRTVLRRATHDDHERVDHMLSQLDITDHGGFGQFLGIHSTCFQAMRDATPEPSIAHAALSDMLLRIGQDLEKLSESAIVGEVPTLAPVDPLALDYVLEGSRLGTRVLKTQWMETADARVTQADRYFSMVTDAGRWREVCETLSAIDPQSPRATAIIADARALFEMFYTVSKTRIQPTDACPHRAPDA